MINRRPLTEERWLEMMGDWYLPEPNTGCWLWMRYCNEGGYGWVRHKGIYRAAHRVAYELLRAPIPSGLTLDHLCRIPCCVNPAHLEPVTMYENIMRGKGVCSMNAKKTHCKHGHEFTTENTIMISKGRSCRECERLYRRGERLLRRHIGRCSLCGGETIGGFVRCLRCRERNRSY